MNLIPKKAKKLTISIAAPKALPAADYESNVQEIKKECTKSAPDINHLQELVTATFINRREWINKSPSTDLHLTTILDKFPCFHMNPMLYIELELILKNHFVCSTFEGMAVYYFFIYILLKSTFHKSFDIK
jgi:hypothetical protein